MRWSLERNSYTNHTKINQTALTVLLMILDLMHVISKGFTFPVQYSICRTWTQEWHLIDCTYSETENALNAKHIAVTWEQRSERYFLIKTQDFDPNLSHCVANKEQHVMDFSTLFPILFFLVKTCQFNKTAFPKEVLFSQRKKFCCQILSYNIFRGENFYLFTRNTFSF